MNTFDDRKKTFERKFAHDQDITWKATVRRNNLIGLWAAEKMGLTGQQADDYAKSVIAADFEEVGDQDVIRKLEADFKAHKVEISRHMIERQMQEFLDEARRQIMKETN